jgi:putative membrane protein
MKLVLRWLVNTVAILVAAYLLPAVTVVDLTWALVAAAVLGILNTFVRPVFRLLALPLTILTLGLFILVVNGFILEILDWLMGTRLEIDGFLWSVVAALIIAVVTTLINVLLGSDEKRSRSRRRPNGRPARA